MPGQVPPITDERDGLISYLRQMRLVMRLTAYGLTDDQARTAAVASTGLTVGGLIKHVASVESSWVDMILQQAGQGPEAYEDNFRMGPDETLAGILDRYDAVAARTESVLAGIDDLAHPVPVPKGVPWFPQDIDAWSVRWVLLHVIQETARHAGHADIVREAVDGATAFPLMAAAEGWPETPWMQPWRPAEAS